MTARARRRFIACLLAASTLIASAAEAATITVTSAADGTSANGAVTLREALASVNASADLNADVTAMRVGAYGVGDAIHFAVGSGTLTIVPTQALPVLVRAMAIDGSTQPGSARVTIDGTSSSAGTDGLRVIESVAVALNALDIDHFSGAGVRVGGTLEYGIFADGFETPGLRPAAAALYAPIALTGVALGQNGIGLRVDVGLVQLAQTIVADSGGDGIVVGSDIPAQTATVSMAGGVSVATNGGAGIEVRPNGTLALTDPAPQPQLSVQQNQGFGLDIRGAVTRTTTAIGSDIGYNGEHGIVIDTDGAVTIGSSAIHHSGQLPGAPPARHGVLIQRAGSTASIVLDGERPTLRSTTSISDNTGDGVHVAASAIAAGAAVAVGDVDISGNAIGVFVDLGNDGRNMQLADVDVYSNLANGMFFRSAPAMFRNAATTPPVFAQNKVHNNALNQIVLAGGTYYVNSPNDACDAGTNAVYCYAARSVFGIFAQDSASVFVEHVSFEGGGTGLRDFGAQSGSTISVTSNCTAITVCP